MLRANQERDQTTRLKEFARNALGIDGVDDSVFDALVRSGFKYVAAYEADPQLAYMSHDAARGRV